MSGCTEPHATLQAATYRTPETLQELVDGYLTERFRQRFDMEGQNGALALEFETGASVQDGSVRWAIPEKEMLARARDLCTNVGGGRSEEQYKQYLTDIHRGHRGGVVWMKHEEERHTGVIRATLLVAEENMIRSLETFGASDGSIYGDESAVEKYLKVLTTSVSSRGIETPVQLEERLLIEAIGRFIGSTGTNAAD